MVFHLRLTSHCRIAAAWHICRSDQGQPTDWEGIEKQDTAEWSYRSFAVFKIKNDSSIVVVTAKDKLVLRSIIHYIAMIDSPTNESIYCVLSLCHMLSKKPTPDPRHGYWLKQRGWGDCINRKWRINITLQFQRHWKYIWQNHPFRIKTLQFRCRSLTKEMKTWTVSLSSV